MSGDLLWALTIPWLSQAGFVAWVAERHDWPKWRWWAAAFVTGPVSWLFLYLKVRDRKERVGPGRRRRELEAKPRLGKRIG